MQPTHVYEIRPRRDNRSVDPISDVLPFGRLWYEEPNAIANAIGYAALFSRSHAAVLRVCDEAGNVIEMHEQTGPFRGPVISKPGGATVQGSWKHCSLGRS
jgi:hypothetical protein